MKLYIHPTIIVTKDFGEVLCKETGVMWSKDGIIPWRGSFEHGDFETLLAHYTLLAEGSLAFEVVKGEPLTRSHDLNPHGLV